MTGEPTTLSPALIGFYACCALVSVGAAVTAMVLVVFAGQSFTAAVAAIGIAMTVGGALGAWLSLRAARKE